MSRASIMSLTVKTFPCCILTWAHSDMLWSFYLGFWSLSWILNSWYPAFALADRKYFGDTLDISKAAVVAVALFVYTVRKRYICKQKRIRQWGEWVYPAGSFDNGSRKFSITSCLCLHCNNRENDVIAPDTTSRSLNLFHSQPLYCPSVWFINKSGIVNKALVGIGCYSLQKCSSQPALNLW